MSEPAGAAAWTRWLPLLLIPLIGVVGAGLLLWDGASDSAQEAAFPTPAPVTFVPPTPIPSTPIPTPGLMDSPVPDFVLTALDGESINLRALQGQVVFVNFWATWCGPCEAEMPALQRLQDEHGADGVRVIAITDPNGGQTVDDVQTFIDEHDLSLTVVLSSDQDLYLKFNVLQIPATYIIDREGIVRYRHLGELDDDLIARYLELLATS